MYKVTVTWDTGCRERDKPSVNGLAGVILPDNSVHYANNGPVPDMDAPTNPDKAWIQLQSGWYIAVRYPSSSGIIERARVELVEPVTVPFTLAVDGFKPVSGKLEKA
jgi:hypothetical protein